MRPVRCRQCDELLFEPSPVCRHCLGPAFTRSSLHEDLPMWVAIIVSVPTLYLVFVTRGIAGYFVVPGAAVLTMAILWLLGKVGGRF